MNIPTVRSRQAGVQTHTPSSRSAGRAWLVTILLFVFMLINFADKAVLGLAAKPIMTDLGLSPSEYGLISSGFYFLFSLSAIIVGFVSNRVPTKWILLVLALVWALSMLPILWTAGFGVLLASRVVLGAAEGPANPMAMHAAHKWFPNEKRALPSALLNVGAGVGVTLAAPLLTMVIINYGWRWAFFSLFAIGMVWVLLWLLLGKEGNVALAAATQTSETAGEEADDSPELEEPTVPYRRILLSGTWLGGFLAGFAAYWALSLLVSWVPAYLQTALGYSATTTGTLVILPWAASATFMLAQGVVTDWLMHRGVSSRMARGVLGGIAVLIAGAAMLLFPQSSGALQIALLTVAFSIGGVMFAIGVTVNAEICPARQRGAVLAITVGLVTTAGLLGPYLTGLIVESTGTPAAGYALAFTIIGVLLLVGGLLAVIFVRPERTARRLGVLPAEPRHV